MADPRHADHLTEADQRLVRSVDGLSGEEWHAPSLLPGWTRAHVVAHLALNGEALADVLRGVTEDSPVPMYDTQDQRDADIEELTGAPHSEIRERLLASTSLFADAVAAVPEDGWAGRFERTTGGPTLPVDAVPLMRLREVEIHHADLALGYSPDDWSSGFAEVVVTGMVKRLDPAEGFRVAPLDSDRSWEVGDAGEDSPVVTGPVAHLAWWLTGRTPSELVSCSRGELPQVGGW